MKKLMLAALGALTLPAIASAQTASGTYGGHTYQYYAGDVSFEQALRAADAAGGYLANVTSAGEQAFLHGLTTDRAWLGGTDEGSEGLWRWRDGPEAGRTFYSATGASTYYDFHPWASGEPNNYSNYASGGEQYLVINWDDAGNWNDLDEEGLGAPYYNVGYIVEIDGPAAVPELATWAMMIAGFGLVGATLRRRAGRPTFA